MDLVCGTQMEVRIAIDISTRVCLVTHFSSFALFTPILANDSSDSKYPSFLF